MQSAAPKPMNDAVTSWLMVVYGLIAVMVVIGGVTRLTQSGLSMVTWHPIAGTVPPISEADWQAEFDRYKAFPQYAAMFANMTIEQFKGIFFWEYVHRLFGRVIGLAFFVPWLFFVIRKKITGRWIGWTGLAFILGGLQGVLGWYMVKSGLVDKPAISHFRLAAHLCLAFFVANYILVLILRRRTTHGAGREQLRLRNWALGLLAVLVVQVVYGAFMAGTRAGYMYQTWPLMNGVFFPENALLGPSFWDNLVNNVDMIQFIHRSLGWVALVLGIGVAIAALRSNRSSHQRTTGWLLAGLMTVQFGLGVSVILVDGIPPWMGASHQLCAFFLVSTCVALIYSCGRRERPTHTEHYSAA
ncbi:MAG: COX15/CtaA family protein [Myxococcota bacterium]|nr:COX15/CtaA family protein [Myxococcota bacterium]